MAKHSIREELLGVVAFVGFIWCVFIMESVFPFRLESYGVTPRTLRGLIGIPASPFLHSSLTHLISNTLPLVVLLLLLAGSNPQSWEIVAGIILLSGTLLWLFGRSATHIGASGLIYGLIAYLIVSGIREGRLIPFVIAVVVGLLYGSTLATGILPNGMPNISWDGHLFGAISGGLIAYLLTNRQNTTEAVATIS